MVKQGSESASHWCSWCRESKTPIKPFPKARCQRGLLGTPARQGSSAGAAFPACQSPGLPWHSSPGDRAQHSPSSVQGQPGSGARQGCPGLTPLPEPWLGFPSCSREQDCRYPAPSWGTAPTSTGTAVSPHPACALDIPRCSSKTSLKRQADKKPCTQPHIPEHGKADGLIEVLVPKENQN